MPEQQADREQEEREGYDATQLKGPGGLSAAAVVFAWLSWQATAKSAALSMVLRMSSLDDPLVDSELQRIFLHYTATQGRPAAKSPAKQQHADKGLHRVRLHSALCPSHVPCLVIACTSTRWDRLEGLG